MPTKSKKSKPDSASRDAYILIGVIMLFLLAAGFLVVEGVLAKQARAKAEQEQQKENTRLGLPADYPNAVAPIYQGAHVTKGERTSGKSTQGEPMDQWNVYAETSEDKQVVTKFYNELLMKRGMSQTFYASVPNGIAATYSDETTEIQLVVEKKKADKLTQIEIKLSRLVDAH
jgi:hypothetical protein